jgi:probable HAF family extracellular repeat protein
MIRVAVVSAVSLAAVVASAQPPKYTITEIPSPTAYGLAARSLNNAGQVVGYFAVGPFIDNTGTPAHAFLYSGGVVRDLFPGDSLTTFSVGNAVNDLGQVAGERRGSPDGYGQPFLYEKDAPVILNPFAVPNPALASGGSGSTRRGRSWGPP